MKRRNWWGFTLIEVLVVSMIVGLMLPPIGAAFYNFVKVPPEETHELTAINDVSLAFQWITDDASQANAFFPGVSPNKYGGFFWRDHTTDRSYSVFYEYDDSNGALVRNEFVDNDLVSSFAVARYIANEDDVSFTTIGKRVVKVDIESSVPHWGGYRTDEGTAFVFLSAESYIFDYTVLAAGRSGKSIDISGRDVTIRGDVRVNGEIEVSAGFHQLQDGQVYMTFDGIYDIGVNSQRDPISHPSGWPWPDNPLSGVNREDVFEVVWPFEFTDFIPVGFDPDDPPPNYYVFDDNMVDLKDYPEVWVDDTTLKDGIYYNQRAGGTIKINENGVTGRVTLISDYIDVTADINLSPFAEGVILYGTAGTPSAHETDVIKTSVAGGTWSGILFAPNGEISMSGSNFVLYGFLMCQYLKLSSSNGGLIIVFM